MGAGLGFKTFVTGDVLTAADTNGYLMQGVWVFANAAARTAAVTSPQEGNMSYLKDTNSTEYYSGSAWTPVSAGGGGKVLQVVQGTTTTATTIASTTFTDSTLTATITPSATTSKVLVMVAQFVTVSANTRQAQMGINLMRGATQLGNFGNSGYETYGGRFDGSTLAIVRAIVNFNYLDSPSTTSATTYKTQGKLDTTANGQSLVFQETGSTNSVIILMEIGA